MIDGFSGTTVEFFRPAFRGHMLTAVVSGNNLIGKIEDCGKSEFQFGGKDLRSVLDMSTKFYLLKIVVPVPAFDVIDGNDLDPLEMIDDQSA